MQQFQLMDRDFENKVALTINVVLLSLNYSPLCWSEVLLWCVVQASEGPNSPLRDWKVILVGQCSGDSASERSTTLIVGATLFEKPCFAKICIKLETKFM